MEEIRFDTVFLNEYFGKATGKEVFTLNDLKNLKNIIVEVDRLRIT